MTFLRRAPAAALFFLASAAHAGHPNADAWLRVLGPRAGLALSGTRSTGTLEALVRLPFGATAESLGLEPVVPGYGRVRGGASAVTSFASAHPTLSLEVAPPLHMLLDKAAGWTNATAAQKDPTSRGAGVLVGVADTGLDVAHADFLDASGKTRVAWLLDLSTPPTGKYPDLERKFGVLDSNGNVLTGAVYSADDINLLLAAGLPTPTDVIGHGTHVTSIAAGNGGAAPGTKTPYVGFAPDAGIVFARLTRDATDNIDNGDLVRGVQFLFDRADVMRLPISVNLSLGSDFGSHDGTMDWEQALAAFVGPSHPGHALVAAAGNSGSIADAPVHQSVGVTPGQRARVPIVTQGAPNGSLEVWITMRAGATLSVGFAGPDGEWIAPIAEGNERGKNAASYNAGVINGSGLAQSPIPTGSHGAVAVVAGTLPSGVYAVELEGSGTADLYLEGTGDVIVGSNAGFAAPVREGTINLPATSPSILGVGCTVNRPQWTSIDDVTESQKEPVLDSAGGLAALGASGSVLTRPVSDGEVAWFSSAGPTVTGVQKPEIAAPGGVVIGAMSSAALPGNPNSIFTTDCPAKNGQPGGTRCLQVDATHGISQGTSMASPMVAGTVALLFERDPTLTQDKVLGLLQAGAHPFRGASYFDDQSGPGELDVAATLDALEQARDPAQLLPSAAASWLTLSAAYVAADGSTPVTAIVELRTAPDSSGRSRRADLFDPSRLRPVFLVDGAPQSPPELQRRAPGVWTFTIAVPSGHGGSSCTLGATFDGAPIVQHKTIPIAVDIWRGEYASRAKGGCAIAPAHERSSLRGVLALVLAGCALARRSARRLVRVTGTGREADRNREC